MIYYNSAQAEYFWSDPLIGSSRVTTTKRIHTPFSANTIPQQYFEEQENE